MPRIPKWMGDAMEAVSQKYIHKVEITATENIEKYLKKIRFKGDLGKTNFVAGNVIEFRISDTDYRHYTPSSYDAEKGICEVIFYLHSLGPGSDWAQKLETGNSVKLMGPGGRLKYMSEYKNHFVFGDETSIGLMLCMEKAVAKNQQALTGILEIKRIHYEWPDIINCAAQFVEASLSDPAAPSIERMNQYPKEFWDAMNETCFYLTGRAKSIQAFRKFLFGKGVSAKQIKTEPYWAEGKKGL